MNGPCVDRCGAIRRTFLLMAGVGAVCSLPVSAQDWTNAGGNAGRNGRTGEVGPDAADVLWTGGRSSIIAWQPVTLGRRAFMVRQTGFPPEPNSDESPVVAMDLDTGAELWFVHVPARPADWTTWVLGARDGRVYVSRSGNGSSVYAPVYALDAADGSVVWVSDVETGAGAYDGVVFAPDGDLIVADFRKIYRISALDGSTVWTADRLCSVSGNCGPSATQTAVYVADAAVGGHVVKRYDLATGAFQYESPVMSGFTLQNTPMVAPDGTIYLSRTQNNPAVDYFYAIDDTGAAMSIRWSVPAGWTTVSEFAVGPDGSVYMAAPGNRIRRLDAATGATLAESDSLDALSAPRMATDAQGRVYVSNGAFAQGRFYSFDADLTPRWSVPVQNINIGAPAIGADGALVVCGVGTDVRAYRTERNDCPADFNGDTVVNSLDFIAFLNAYTAGDPKADFNGDTVVNSLDVLAFLNAYVLGCG